MSIYCNSLSELSRQNISEILFHFCHGIRAQTLRSLHLMFGSLPCSKILVLCSLFFWFFFVFFLGPDLLVLVSGRVMSLERFEHFLVRFNGKNYSAWVFQFQIFVKGKELWGHIDRTDPASNNEKDKETYVKWEVKDAQIMSWILGSVEPSILLNLMPYKTSREMWEYLKKIYNQSNTA